MDKKMTFNKKKKDSSFEFNFLSDGLTILFVIFCVTVALLRWEKVEPFKRKVGILLGVTQEAPEKIKKKQSAPPRKNIEEKSIDLQKSFSVNAKIYWNKFKRQEEELNAQRTDLVGFKMRLFPRVIQHYQPLVVALQEYVTDAQANGAEGHEVSTGKLLLELLAALSQLYAHQQDAMVDNENALKISQVKLEEFMVLMIEQLSAITKDDLRDLIYWAQDIEYEKASANARMAMVSQEWDQYHEAIFIRLSELVGTLPASDAYGSQNVIQTFQEASLATQDMIVALIQNNTAWVEAMATYWGHVNKLLTDLTGLIDIDLPRLVTDSYYLEEKNANYLKNRRK